MATLEGLPDPAQVSSADAAARAAAAEAANLAYRTNTAPVLAPYGASSGITQAEQEDAAREAAKHAAAFHPAEYYGVNPSDLGNVPLSLIASRYGTGMADIVQGYFTQNPTAEAQAIKQQYAAQHQTVENPYDPNTAAGIAWLSARQGTPVSASLGQKAIQQGYQGDLYAVSGISTVPVRDYSSGMLTGSKMVAALPSGTTTVFMPYGEYAQIEMKGAKALLDYQTGELGVYQQPFGHSQFMLTGGGGRAALQSGMFTVERPETPYVISQERAGTYVLPSGTGLSRLGAEAYGGFVRPLSAENLLAPNEAISRYYGAGGEINLANLVQQIPAGKAETPGAKIPWSVEAGMPVLSYMDERGIIPGSAITIPGESGRLVGGKTIAGEPTISPAETALPTPFLSTSAPAASEKMTVFGFEVPQPIAAASKGLTGFESAVRSYLPSQEVGERALRISEYTNPFMAGPAIASTLTETFNPKAAGEVQAAESLTGLRGQYTQFYERPTLAATSFALGAGFGLAGKGVSAIEDYTRAAAAERIISQGGAYRTAEQFSGFVMETAPKVLGGLYAADVGIRSTQGLTNFAPESVVSRARGIAVQEVAPMGMGFVKGYETPSAVYSRVEPGIQRAKLEFPQFVEEAGGSVARAVPQYAGYKISQTPAYEAATAPIARAKLQIPQFIEEAGGSTAKGIAGYAQYKVQRPIAEAQARVDVGIEQLLHPSRFKGVEGTENIYQPKSTLNIFGRETPTAPARKLTGEQEPIPTGTVEIRSSSGMVQLARVEQMPVTRMEQSMQALDSRMMPEYPRGPSPFSTQRFRVEEETQYFVLPPGMTSPGPKRQTIQEIIAIPSTAMGQVSAQIIAPAQRVGSEVISRQITQQVPRSEIAVSPRMAQFQTPWQTTGPSQRIVPSVTPALIQAVTPITTPFTVPLTTPYTVPVTTPYTTPITRITQIQQPSLITPPYKPPQYPLPPGLPAAPILPTWGGGAVGGGSTRKRKAAFMETFLLGLDLSIRGRRTKAAKSFTTPKKYKRTAPAKKKGGKK